MRDRREPIRLILLVEDNATIRHAFSILLEETGYRVAQAASGQEALAVARSDAPDLILMDLGLPDMSGLDVTRQLKADPETSAIAVVALTGRGLDSDREACLAVGCVDYIRKPVDTAKLISAIPTYFGRRNFE